MKLWYETTAHMRGPTPLNLPVSPPPVPFTILCRAPGKSGIYDGANYSEAAAKAVEFFRGFGDVDGIVHVQFWVHP